MCGLAFFVCLGGTLILHQRIFSTQDSANKADPSLPLPTPRCSPIVRALPPRTLSGVVGYPNWPSQLLSLQRRKEHMESRNHHPLPVLSSGLPLPSGYQEDLVFVTTRKSQNIGWPYPPWHGLFLVIGENVQNSTPHLLAKRTQHHKRLRSRQSRSTAQAPIPDSAAGQKDADLFNLLSGLRTVPGACADQV